MNTEQRRQIVSAVDVLSRKPSFREVSEITTQFGIDSGTLQAAIGAYTIAMYEQGFDLSNLPFQVDPQSDNLRHMLLVPKELILQQAEEKDYQVEEVDQKLVVSATFGHLLRQVEFDENGRCTRVEHTSPHGYHSKYNFTYDQEGNLVESLRNSPIFTDE